jgi:hypothetical protein
MQPMTNLAVSQWLGLVSVESEMVLVRRAKKRYYLVFSDFQWGECFVTCENFYRLDHFLLTNDTSVHLTVT